MMITHITTEANFGRVDEHMQLDSGRLALYGLDRPQFGVESRKDSSKL